jgi:ribokinase
MINWITVIGSMNMDMVVQTGHIPKPGETVLGNHFFMNPGGKGANQAIAVSRLGGKVSFVGKIGNDVFGKQARQLFDEEGIETQFLIEDEDTPSGIALITVDKEGENSIVVAPGANSQLSNDDITTYFDKHTLAGILLIQLEIPMHTVQKAAECAKQNNMYVIVNPAPANEDIQRIYHLIDIITPNISEAEILTGISINNIYDVKNAASKLVELGVKNVIITLGKDGALILENNIFTHVPAPEVEVIDTTAAGDVFNGALAVYLSQGKCLIDSVNFACRAASISVTRLGAQSTIPYRSEVLMNMVGN